MLYSYEESVDKYGSKYLLSKAVESREIFRLDRGVYSDEEYVSEQQIIAFKYPDAVLTMNSAFYYYDLTDVIPEKYYLATDRDSTKISDTRVIQVFERCDLLMMGATLIEYKGYKINIYSKERLLIELLRHKSKIPFDYYKEVILSYREIIHDLDIRVIQDYADAIPKSAKILRLLQSEVL